MHAPRGFYGNHPQGTRRSSDIARKRRASSPHWRLSDGQSHPVTVRRIGA